MRALAGRSAHRRAVREVMVIREGTVLRAIGLLAVEAHLIGEGSGAVGLAALPEDPERRAGKTVALIFSGGNLDGEILKRAVEVFLAEEPI